MLVQILVTGMGFFVHYSLYLYTYCVIELLASTDKMQNKLSVFVCWESTFY